MVQETLKEAIQTAIAEAGDKIAFINELREFIHELSPLRDQPVDFVRWLPLDRVEANGYNPNSVASREMGLLYTSIKQDGYTQPIVTIEDGAAEKNIIVDGFHRFFTGKKMADIRERTRGHVPVVTIDKDINDRMASTVRHNRARGVHALSGMSSMVFEMLKNGWKDGDICNELGMDAEELLKLKHITGFSRLFEDVSFKPAWKTTEMIQVENKYKRGHTSGNAEKNED
ncbi:MAG: ParB/RepB/Spo0J family partition protein [Treponema sp.]|jgi:ParB-like chromosome segregation protein Spo0J|nr:ParB/RepB/Spo0J family partition protein [Treponema sp.]